MSVLSSSYIKLQLQTSYREKREDMVPLSKSVSNSVQEEECVKPEVCRQQMPLSRLSKLFTMEDNYTTCWYIRDIKQGFDKDETEFKRTFLNPPNKVLKDDVIEKADKALKLVFEAQKRNFFMDNDYDLDFIELMNIKRNYLKEERDGVEPALCENLLFDREILCKTDAVTEDSILKIQCPFGTLSKTGDEYEIPMDQLVEMVFEMEAYDRKVAYFCQYYSYNTWRLVVDRLVWLYKLYVREKKIPDKTVVFYPSLNRTDKMSTILERIQQEAPEKDLWDFWKRYCNPSFFIPDINPYDNTQWEEKDREYYMELHLRRYLNDIIKYTTEENLTEAGYDPSQITKIIEKTRKGNEDDIKRGVMQPGGRVLWDGDNDAKELPKDFAEGLKTILKIILNEVTLKNESKWNAFMNALSNGNIRFLPVNHKGYNALVIQKIELTQGEFQLLKVKIEEFITAIESVMTKRLKCIGDTGNVMLGENSKKKKFETYLRTLPVNTIVNERINMKR